MWKDYVSGYIKNNRSSGISVMIAAFISSLLLSLLCGLFYNMWNYEIQRIKLEEGAWHSRVIGEEYENDIEVIKNYGNVKDVVLNEKAAKDGEMVLDLYFKDIHTVFKDMSHIMKLTEISPEDVNYNYELLAMYLVRSPDDPMPRMVFPLFLLIMAVASVSLIMVIHNAFAVSMNARIHQFGIFASIGATPKQIRSCLLQEAAVLCAMPVIAGNLFSIGISMVFINVINMIANDISGRRQAGFVYHPLVLTAAVFVTVITILISAWIPAGKLSKLTPLEAIKNTGELQLKRKKNSRLLAYLFGIKGELAGNAGKAQKKALRTSSLSLTAAFLAFTLMQCFFTLSRISTRETYFERYQSVWDIMVTVKDTDVDIFNETEKIRQLSAIRNVAIYQKAMAKRMITEDEISEEMKSFGGFAVAKDKYVSQTDAGYLVNVPIIILDDQSFLEYCGQVGIKPELNGAIIRNRICDVTNPDFRHPRYMPYLKGENDTSVLRAADHQKVTAEIPVLSYTEKVPVLREEYATLDHFELVHFIPASLWQKIKGKIGGMEHDTYIRILGRKGVTLEELNALQGEVEQLLAGNYVTESENRIQEKEVNDKQIQGMMAILSSFCVLLAIIGIGNVFSNTLGFIYQRKREFARYMSIGMTPDEIKKMFCIEGVIIAGRPIVFALPLAAAAVWLMLRASYMEISVFLAETPLIPILVFMLAVIGTVVFAYYLGWRNIREIDLAEVLRDDTMM